MESAQPGREAIDAYLQPFPAEVRERCEAIRSMIHRVVPEVVETISWGMPTFKLDGNLVHFAVHTRHIGFYPGPEGVAAFVGDLADHAFTKGAIQFPFDRPLPLDLIERITLFRVAANRRDAEAKRMEKAIRRATSGKGKATGAQQPE